MCFCVLVQRKLSVESNNKKEKENTVLSENKIEAHIQYDIPLVLVMSVFLVFLVFCRYICLFVFVFLDLLKLYFYFFYLLDLVS